MTSKRNLLIILFIVSIGAHFAFFGHPNETVFDEVHFGKFISAYYTHEYSFDIHPPAGKLIIAGFGKLFNFSPEYSFAEIGQPFPDNKYLLLRFLPTLAGTLLPIIIFLLALQFGIKPLLAWLAGFLIIFENALLAQSRYILLDMFLLIFGFASLLFYFKYRNSKKTINLLWMGLLLGLTISIKWTGLAFLGLIGLVELISILPKLSWRQVGSLALYFTIIPLTIYYTVFTIHFSLLTRSGEGDPFMTPQFLATMQGTTAYQDPNIQPLSNFGKFTELNKEMFRANQGLTATHPYGSKWYTWPLMIRPIYYWNSSVVGANQKIYLIGNPIVWWGSTVAILYLILTSVGGLFSRIKEKIGQIDIIPLVLIGGWFINFLPFIGIGRVMFLYHYLTGLIFAILALAYCLDSIRKPRNTVIAIAVMTLALFIYFAPLSYGLTLSPETFNDRMWLKSWR